jgi:hypothetical protein
MPTDWHPQDWIMIVSALSVYDHWRDQDDEQARRIYELQKEIAWMHGFDYPGEFILQAEIE